MSHAWPRCRWPPSRGRSTATATSPRKSATGSLAAAQRAALHAACRRPQPQQPPHPDPRRGAAGPARRVLLRTDARHRPGRARARACTCWCRATTAIREEQGAALRAMRGRVDGLLVMSPYVAAPTVLSEHLEPSLPAVLINSQAGLDGAAVIGVDNYGGARGDGRTPGRRRASPHRLHRRARRQLRRPRTPARLSRRARRGCCPTRGRGCCRATSTRPPAIAPAANCSRLASGRDAVFAANDMMALGCLFAFAQAGVRVPRRHRPGRLRRHSAGALRPSRA